MALCVRRPWILCIYQLGWLGGELESTGLASVMITDHRLGSFVYTVDGKWPLCHNDVFRAWKKSNWSFRHVERDIVIDKLDLIWGKLSGQLWWVSFVGGQYIYYEGCKYNIGIWSTFGTDSKLYIEPVYSVQQYSLLSFHISRNDALLNFPLS